MNREQYAKIEKWFWDYVAGFVSQDDFVAANLELKNLHTRKVCDEMQYLADALSLSESDSLIASTIALLHDTARFEQFVKYRTYSDAKSFNHSTRAVEILTENGVLDCLSDRHRKIIETAIACHGVKKLCDGHDHETAMFAKLIRDADKIDILRVAIKNYHEYERCPEGFVNDIPEPNNKGWTDAILIALMSRQPVDYNMLRTVNDVKLLQMGWIFDVNFPQTLKRMRDQGHIQEIISLLPEHKQLQKAADMVRAYMEEKISQINA